MTSDTADAGTARDFCRTLASTESAVRDTLGEVCGWMRQRRLGDDDIGTAELVMAEILNNVVEHAYPSEDGGWIRLRVADNGGCLTLTVSDGGAAMARGAPPDTGLPSVDTAADALPEGGFGWALIRQLSGDLSYRRIDGQNRLSLTLPCAGGRD